MSVIMQPEENVQTEKRLKQLARKIFDAGLAAVDPAACIQNNIEVSPGILEVCDIRFPLEGINHIFLVGIGKASAAMAFAVEEILGNRIHKGVVVTKYGHGLDLKVCEVLEAGHPIPDANGVMAADRIIEMVSQAGSDDLIICLVSGGGSALVPAPAQGIPLEAKQETTRLLLGCGATIHEINTIRKHLSRIKGGQLCRNANGARIVSMVLSDVIGDDLDMIASGITVPDNTDFGQCKEILTRYNLLKSLPPNVLAHIENGSAGKKPETPKPGSSLFDRVENFIVGSLSDALDAAALEAERSGFPPLILSSMVQGEAFQVARVLGAVAKEVHRSSNPLPAPVCILSGGETTVTLKGDGKGGRNMELALAAGIELDGHSDMVLLSAGTDGSDGPTDAAGAFVTGSTLKRAENMGLDARAFLANNNSYHFFTPLGDLLKTGPTRTNVMDLQIFLIDEKKTMETGP